MQKWTTPMCRAAGAGEARSQARWALWPVLFWTMWLLVAVYVIALGAQAVGANPGRDGEFASFVDGWLRQLAAWAVAAVCWVAFSRVRFRLELLLTAAAATSFAASHTLHFLVPSGGSSVPAPSLADLGLLLVQPLLLVALAVTVQRHTRGLAARAWLDFAVGSLGAGAVWTVVLHPMVKSVSDGVPSLATALALASLVCDLLIVAAIAGVAAMRGVAMGTRWVLLASGLLLFATADILVGLLVAAGTYLPGTLLQAGPVVTLTLVAAWADGAHRGTRGVVPGRRPAAPATAVTVSSAAIIAGLAVLVVSSRTEVPIPALVLAAAALLAAVVRAQLAARLVDRMAEQRLLAAATDELTGLPNRRALYAEAQTRLAAPGNRRGALLMLDLDGFKEVNDSLGHRAGDELLIKVGARLRQNLDGDDVLVRLGGDEFAVLLHDGGHDEAVDVAATLCAAVGEPLVVEGTTLRMGASIGIALFPDDGPDLGALLRKADIAMYRAKASRQALHVYSTVHDADAADVLHVVQELRTAVEEDQFVLHYQPKVDLDTSEVHSVEALVRWNHPTRGLLYPDAFLGLVEESGLMPALTRVVLTQALDQVVDWHAKGHLLTVAVNLSASSLSDADLPCQVAAMLAARGLSPSALQLEITERFLVDDPELARGILLRLRDSGVKISVDDFGTGYNTLAHLRELPIDELKLDSSFVIPMITDVRTAAVVSSTITLAHTLGLRIVAEGVETAGAYTELTRMGCDQAQGYFMSKPIPAAELDQWLTLWHTTVGSAGTSEPRSALAPA